VVTHATLSPTIHAVTSILVDDQSLPPKINQTMMLRKEVPFGHNHFSVNDLGPNFMPFVPVPFFVQALVESLRILPARAN
jgi:hypothetical protein